MATALSFIPEESLLLLPELLPLLLLLPTLLLLLLVNCLGSGHVVLGLISLDSGEFLLYPTFISNHLNMKKKQLKAKY